MKQFTNDEMRNICLSVVRSYTIEHQDVTDSVKDFDVYIVWFCKTLQNFKALVSTSIPDGMYYEVTYNGDRDEIYLDAYKKFENRMITSVSFAFDS